MSLEPLQETFDVTIEGDTYTFRIPTIRFDIEVSYKSAEIRNRAYPEGAGTIGGLDFQAVNFSRYCAYLELYLRRATTLWPYGQADDDVGKLDLAAPPKVDFLRFPADRTEDVMLVGNQFDIEVQRFRSRRNRPNGAAGQEAVGGGVHPGAP